MCIIRVHIWSISGVLLFKLVLSLIDNVLYCSIFYAPFLKVTNPLYCQKQKQFEQKTSENRKINFSCVLVITSGLFQPHGLGGQNIKSYTITQLDDWVLVTCVGSLPLETSWQILMTSSKSGNAMVFNLEWMTVSLTLTSKEVRRPTCPETCALGTSAWN